MCLEKKILFLAPAYHGVLVDFSSYVPYGENQVMAAVDLFSTNLANCADRQSEKHEITRRKVEHCEEPTGIA